MFGGSSFTGRQVIYFNLTNFVNDDVNVFNNTIPTSTVLTVKNSEVNSTSSIAYCFAQVAGFLNLALTQATAHLMGHLCILVSVPHF